MAISEERARQIAAEVSAYIAAQREVQKVAAKPRLYVPESARAPGALSDDERAWLLRRIHFVAGRYGLYWLVDQQLAEPGTIDAADDAKVSDVRRVMEKALKCMQEGVSFDDAGLVRYAEG